MKTIAFTIVLNGMPYIKQQANILPDVFDEWHVIEGATLPNHDTGWCKPINPKFYTSNNRSVDGTAEFIDSLGKSNVFIHRKDTLFDGKLEMCNMISDRLENCVLMQFDVDEIWTKEVLGEVIAFAKGNPDMDAMLFPCRYYVGSDLIVTSDNTYGNYDSEWCRLWRITGKTQWISHEPPLLFGTNRILKKDFARSKGWIFDHYAYYTRSQLEFKENYYGYTGAIKQWERLNKCTEFPVNLRHYFSWVHDNAIVDKISK